MPRISPTYPARSALAALGLAVATVGIFGGCMNPPLDDSARTGPFHKAANFKGVSELPATLRRVVLLPVAGGSLAPEESTVAIDQAIAVELQKQNRFEVIAVSRSECSAHLGKPELGSAQPLPHDFIPTLRRVYNADGVLFVDLTAFSAYRPLVLGVRAKLVTVDSETRLLWAFDNMFSAADEDVANSARNHYLRGDAHGGPGDATQAALLSPTRFAGYVGSEMFETLPPVYGSPKPAKK